MQSRGLEQQLTAFVLADTVTGMDYRIFIEPQQGTTYDAVCALAQATEQRGFNGFFTSDHYLRMGDADGQPGPLDAWTTV